MNLNQLMTNVGKKVGLTTAQDIYMGTDTEYIVFTYEDERASYYADNEGQEVTVTMQVQLITPQNYDYFAYKSKLKKELENAGFNVENIRSFLTDIMTGTNRTRQTVFSVNYTGTDI